MSPLLQNSLSNSIYRIKFHFPSTTALFKTPKFSLSNHPPNPLLSLTSTNNGYPLQKNLCFSRNRCCYRIQAYDSSASAFPESGSSNTQLNFDAFLSFVESVCVISSVVVSVGCIVSWAVFKQQNLGLLALGNRVLVYLLAGSVAVGSVIRRRQWRRVCGLPASKSKVESGNGNVVERIEQLEESMRSATTIIRMLSRQLEKLGVRFRLHRKALKEPIAETAALAQKNSEATRALAVQEDILEKELSEVQKVLLAMQDQQQKQLELILAIAKSGKLFDTKQESPSQRSISNEKDTKQESPNQRSVSNEKDSAGKQLKQVDGQQIEGISGQQVATNDIAY